MDHDLLDKAIGYLAVAAVGFVLGMLACEEAHSAELGMNTMSYHSNNNQYYNNQNGGLYLKSGNDGWFYAGGFYRNSYERWSYHAGGGYSWQATRELSFAASVEAVTGYKWAVAPSVAPSMAYRFDQKQSARIVVLPKVPNVTNAWVFSLAFEGEF